MYFNRCSCEEMYDNCYFRHLSHFYQKLSRKPVENALTLTIFNEV